MHTTKPSVTVGAKNCAESRILGEIIAQLFENHTDLKIKRRLQLEGTAVCFHALLSKDIDLYVEYTGTAFKTILKDDHIYGDQEAIEILRHAFEKDYHLTWLEPLGFFNSYCFLMKESFAKKHQIYNLTSLFSKESLFVGMDAEFFVRDEFSLLQKKYHWQDLSTIRLFDHAMQFVCLENGSIDACVAFSTEGLAQDPSLILIEDDRCALPQYIAAPIIRMDVLKNYPQVERQLKKLSGIVSEEKIRKMNYEAEKKGINEYHIARRFLLENQLL